MVEIDAKVRELGNEGCEARLINISETGFMAESDGEFEVGTRIWLMLPGRERANALVRWTGLDERMAKLDHFFEKVFVQYALVESTAIGAPVFGSVSIRYGLERRRG